MFPDRSARATTLALTVIALTQSGCIVSADETHPVPPFPQVKNVPHVEGRSDPLPPPLASEGSDRLALSQAESAGSNAALIMFLARFADSPLTVEARARLRARLQPDAAGVAEAAAGTDAGVVRAFDAARLQGPAGLESFIAAHASHPLAAEARLWLKA